MNTTYSFLKGNGRAGSLGESQGSAWCLGSELLQSWPLGGGCVLVNATFPLPCPAPPSLVDTCGDPCAGLYEGLLSSILRLGTALVNGGGADGARGGLTLPTTW